MHTGDGLIPGTMQRDPEGLDGEASTCRRNAAYYRDVQGDETFLATCLAAVLGQAAPPPAPRRRLSAPDLLDRLTCLADGIGRRRLRTAITGLSVWQNECLPSNTPAPQPSCLPDDPFVLLLLQAPEDPRLRLDADDPPDQALLTLSTRDAVRSWDPGARVVLVPPPGGMRRDQLARLRGRAEGLILCDPATAPAAAATAAAIVTINHPTAMVGILAGTPVVHLGRTPYGVPGIALPGALDRLAQALERASELDQNRLAERFATRILSRDHVWCDARDPDPNGLRGLVADIERHMRAAPSRADPLVYRAGPSWPLSSRL